MVVHVIRETKEVEILQGTRVVRIKRISQRIEVEQ